MSSTSYVLPVICTLLLSLTTYVMHSLFFHPLSKVPGPFLARAGLGYMTVRAIKRDVGWTLESLHRTYASDIVRVGRNMCSVADPREIRQIYKHGTKFSKTSFYANFKGAAGTESAMSIRDNERYAARRKIESPAYATKTIVELEHRLDPPIDSLIDLVRRFIDSSKVDAATVELPSLFKLFTLDGIGELTLSRSFGLCDSGKDELGFAGSFAELASAACLTGTQNWATVPIMLVKVMMGAVNGFVACGKFTERLLRERFAEPDDQRSHHDMLAKYLETSGVKADVSHLQDSLGFAAQTLGAGFDTQAMAMCAFVRCVVGHPQVRAKLQAEIDEAFENGKLSWPIKYADAVKLDYLQATIKETLRCYPGVHWLLPRRVPTSGAVICDTFLPEGTEVGVSPYVIHRSQAAYGRDAKSFRPERWLDAVDAPLSSEDKVLMERYFVPFGHGSRVCIGKNAAQVMLTKALPAIMRRFDFAFVSRGPESPHKTVQGRTIDGQVDPDEPCWISSQWFGPQSDFWVTVKERVI